MHLLTRSCRCLFHQVCLQWLEQNKRGLTPDLVLITLSQFLQRGMSALNFSAIIPFLRQKDLTVFIDNPNSFEIVVYDSCLRRIAVIISLCSFVIVNLLGRNPSTGRPRQEKNVTVPEQKNNALNGNESAEGAGFGYLFGIFSFMPL